MKGLKQLLNEQLKQKGYLSLNEVHKIAKELKYKESNAERRLRQSESPNAEPMFDEKHHIIGYKYFDVLKDEIKAMRKMDKQEMLWERTPDVIQ